MAGDSLNGQEHKFASFAGAHSAGTPGATRNVVGVTQFMRGMSHSALKLSARETATLWLLLQVTVSVFPH